MNFIREHSNWILTEIYGDWGITSKNKVTAFRNMIYDAENKEFDMIVVQGLEKLHRKINALIDLLLYLKAKGSTIFSMNENAEFPSKNPTPH